MFRFTGSRGTGYNRRVSVAPHWVEHRAGAVVVGLTRVSAFFLPQPDWPGPYTSLNLLNAAALPSTPAYLPVCRRFSVNGRVHVSLSGAGEPRIYKKDTPGRVCACSAIAIHWAFPSPGIEIHVASFPGTGRRHQRTLFVDGTSEYIDRTIRECPLRRRFQLM